MAQSAETDSSSGDSRLFSSCDKGYWDKSKKTDYRLAREILCVLNQRNHYCDNKLNLYGSAEIMRRHGSIVLFVLFLFALVLVQGQGDRTLTLGHRSIYGSRQPQSCAIYVGFADVWDEDPL